MNMREDGHRAHLGERPRLLPWSGEGGKASFLSADDGDSFVSRLADAVEAEQLDMTEDLLDYARAALERGSLAEEEWGTLVRSLSAALHDVLRIARREAAGGRTS